MARTKFAFPIFAVAALLCLPAGAASLTEAVSPPVGAIISQGDFSGPAFVGNQDFSDNGGPPGQTFTALSAFSLSSVTLKGFANTAASFGTLATATWTVTINSVSGTVLTRLAQEVTPVFNPTSGSNYLTFTFATPVALVANGVYEFDVSSSIGYFGFAKSATDVYAGGAAVQNGSTSRTAAATSTTTNVQAVDRTFFVQAVPEPSTTLLLGLALAAGAQRRWRLGVSNLQKV